MFKVADSQVASRWGNITDFQGFDLITPNEREARFALGDQDSGIRPLALEPLRRRRLQDADPQARRHAACSPAAHGDHEALDSFFVIDSFVDRLVDAVGAGDALLAYSTLCDAGEQVATSSQRSSAPWRRPANASTTATSRSRPRTCIEKLDAVEREAKFD